MADKEWSIYVVNEVRTWIEKPGNASHSGSSRGSLPTATNTATTAVPWAHP